MKIKDNTYLLFLFGIQNFSSAKKALAKPEIVLSEVTRLYPFDSFLDPCITHSAFLCPSLYMVITQTGLPRHGCA
jgi:hypothetical protein